MSEFDELFKQAVNGSRKNKGKFTLTVGTVKAVEGDTCTVDDYEDIMELKLKLSFAEYEEAREKLKEIANSPENALKILLKMEI